MSRFADRFRRGDPDCPDEAPVSAAWLTIILARNALTESDDIAPHELLCPANLVPRPGPTRQGVRMGASNVSSCSY